MLKIQLLLNFFGSLLTIVLKMTIIMKVKGNVIDPLHMINGVLRDELHPTMHKELIKKLKKWFSGLGCFTF